MFSGTPYWHVYDSVTPEERVAETVRVATVAVQLDLVPTDWFDPIRVEYRKAHPCLEDVPENSSLWPCVAYNDAGLDKFSSAQIRQLLAALPLSASEAGRAAVSVHGDLHPGNILISPTGELVATDFEFSCVSNPLQDLLYLPERSCSRGRRALSAAYLKARGFPCTEIDIEIFALDVVVAAVVHYGVLRPLLFWQGDGWPKVQATEVDDALESLAKLNSALLDIQEDLKSCVADGRPISSSMCARIIDNYIDVRDTCEPDEDRMDYVGALRAMSQLPM